MLTNASAKNQVMIDFVTSFEAAICFAPSGSHRTSNVARADAAKKPKMNLGNRSQMTHALGRGC